MPSPSSSFPYKIAGAFLAVLLVVGGAAVFSIVRLSRSAGDRELVARAHIENLVLAEQMRSASDAMSAAGRGYLLTGNPDFVRRYTDANDDFWRVLSSLDTRVTHGEELFDETRQAANAYTEVQRRVMDQVTNGAPSEEVTRRFELDVVPIRRRLSDSIEAVVSDLEQQMAVGEAEAHGITRRAVIGSVTLLMAALIAGGVLAWLTGQHLARIYRQEELSVGVAERALAARDEVLGIVAHDLRSPLSAIAMKAAVVRRSTTEEKTRKHASMIESVSMRMEMLIAGLLDSASIESSTLTVLPSPCDVDEVMRDVLRELGSLAEPKSIQFDARVAEVGLRVMADRARLIQVLSNVIGNAIKFTFEGGRVEVGIDHVGNEVRFSVADTGPGIPPAHAAHVFDRFWKAETGGKRGTGLGLYIAKGIVEAHGGRIWVESRQGHGATFFFTLPYTGLRSAQEAEAGEHVAH